MSGRVTLTVDGSAAQVVLDNPGKLNALDFGMYEQLGAVCADLRQRPDVRTVVIRGEGDRAFAAGTDIAEFRAFVDLDAEARASAGVAYEARTAEVLGAVADLPMLVIAAVQGPAVGAGLALALMCDVVLAAPNAVFGAPVARTLGNCLSPLVIGALYAAIGRARGRALLTTAALLDAPSAHAIGLVSECVLADQFDTRIHELIEAAHGSAPRTVAAVKAVDRRLMRDIAAIPARDVYEACYASTDFREGVAAFLAKRAPQWSGS